MPLLLSRRTFIQAAASAAALASSGGVASAAERSGSLDRVVRVAVHPALGVARVGNSPDAFFLAPEVSGTTPIGPFKDPEGAMARQAARFRILAVVWVFLVQQRIAFVLALDNDRIYLIVLIIFVVLHVVFL